MSRESDTRYAATWGTEMGQDCITLKISLAKWLGPRLLFLAENTHRGTEQLREFADAMVFHVAHLFATASPRNTRPRR